MDEAEVDGGPGHDQDEDGPWSRPAGAPVTARAVRRVVIATCVLGVAGLIVTNILDRQGWAITIGLLTAAAVLCLIVATATQAPPVNAPRPDAPLAVDEGQAEQLEAMVEALVVGGADEGAVRSLVRAAVRLGRESG